MDDIPGGRKAKLLRVGERKDREHACNQIKPSGTDESVSSPVRGRVFDPGPALLPAQPGLLCSAVGRDGMPDIGNA